MWPILTLISSLAEFPMLRSFSCFSISPLLLCVPFLLKAEAALWDEQQTAADLQRQVATAQINALKSPQQSFLTLQRTAMTPFVKGTVILVPDWSQHAASPRAVEYLRNYLIDFGWNTMAVMVPPAVTEASMENLQAYQLQLLERLKVVMQEAESKPGTIVVIGLGHSGALLNNLYKNEELSPPQALVLIGAAMQDVALNEQVAEAISQHKVPTLDLLPQTDNGFARNSGALRLQLVRKHIKEIYRQRLLPGSVEQDHPWLGGEILGWLRYIGY